MQGFEAEDAVLEALTIDLALDRGGADPEQLAPLPSMLGKIPAELC
jgi:hypothetical protein